MAGDRVHLAAVIRRDGAAGEFTIRLRFPARLESFLIEDADPFLPILMIPCMLTGEAVETDIPASPRLLGSLSKVQDVLAGWFPDRVSRVRVEAPARRDLAPNRGAGVASFFSGGADSFHTLLRNLKSRVPGEPEITHLLFLNGFEHPLGIERVDESVHRMVYEVAKAFGKEAIVGEADFRSYLDAPWGPMYHGAGFVGTALALSAGIRHLYFPCGVHYPNNIHWGQHPELDAYWSTERMEVVCDGAGVSRLEKVVDWVAKDPIALRHLRVCIGNRGAANNCGRCRKCIRTMIPLALVGKLNEASTFPSVFPEKLEKRMVRNILKKSPAVIGTEVRMARENLRLALQTANPDPRIVCFLRRLIRRGRRKIWWEAVKDRFRLLVPGGTLRPDERSR